MLPESRVHVIIADFTPTLAKWRPYCTYPTIDLFEIPWGLGSRHRPTTTLRNEIILRLRSHERASSELTVEHIVRIIVLQTSYVRTRYVTVHFSISFYWHRSNFGRVRCTKSPDCKGWTGSRRVWCPAAHRYWQSTITRWQAFAHVANSGLGRHYLRRAACFPSWRQAFRICSTMMLRRFLTRSYKFYRSAI